MSTTSKNTKDFFKRKSTYILGVIILIVIIVGGGLVNNSRNSPKNVYYSVEKGDIQKYFKDTSVIEPLDIRKVSAQNGSKISDFLFETGSTVSAGQVVAKIDTNGRITDLVSPIAGTVVKINYLTGESISQNEVFQVADISNFKIKSTVSASEISGVKKDQTVKVKIKAIDTETEYDAKVSKVEQFSALNSNNEFSSNYNVEVILNSKPAGAVNGMKANIVIRGESKDNITKIENKLIFQKSDGSKYVKRVDWINKDQNIFSLRDVKVEIGLEGDDYTEITDGLSSGDELVDPEVQTNQSTPFSFLPSR
jgi:multidrug efflux pump subunit AcrA (membrane-fusion protein)